ncbi:hypothetical protein R3I79_004690 [Escherichia coli]|nr:hypothetical protein [Escherichia coli]
MRNKTTGCKLSYIEVSLPKDLVFLDSENSMNYNEITISIENHINQLLSDTVYTERQRHDYAYGAYLAWHAMVREAFTKADDTRLWKLVCYQCE